MEIIKAIETVYNGIRFRSRLEARWAVFFDTVGARYEYEPEGFILEDGTRYLPDFYLPDCDTWVEVKGRMTSEDERKIDLFRNALEAANYEGGPDWPSGILVTVGHILRENEFHLLNGWYWNSFEFSIGWDGPYLPCVCPVCGKFGFEYDGRGARVCGAKHCPDSDKDYTYDDPIILNGYRMAGMARFERGDTPRVTRRV